MTFEAALETVLDDKDPDLERAREYRLTIRQEGAIRPPDSGRSMPEPPHKGE